MSPASVKTFTSSTPTSSLSPFHAHTTYYTHSDTYTHKNSVTKSLSLTSLHTLYLETGKHIFHPMCSNAPFTTSMLQLWVHYLSCFQSNQGGTYICSDHLLKVCSSHTLYLTMNIFIWNLLNTFEVSHTKFCKNQAEASLCQHQTWSIII